MYSTIFYLVQFSSVAQSCPTLWPHGLQHARPPCPSPTPRVHSNSCPLSQWCHPTISSSVVHFSSHLQSFPASVSFQMSQLFTSGGQSTAVSASASILPMKETLQKEKKAPPGQRGSSLSSITVFSNESTLRMRWPEYWSFSFSFILSKEHPGVWFSTTQK